MILWSQDQHRRSRTEWPKCISSRQRSQLRIEETFKTADEEGDGLLSEEEGEAFLKLVGEMEGIEFYVVTSKEKMGTDLEEIDAEKVREEKEEENEDGEAGVS